MRVWHDDDLAHVEADDLDDFIAQAKQVHAARVKAVKASGG